MPTCPFCASPLAQTRSRPGLDEYACPANGTRYLHEHADHWYLVRDDGAQICLRETQASATCSDCAYPEAERVCLRPHDDAHGQPLALEDRPTLAQVRGTEAVEIEGAVVDVEVTHHRCGVHGDDGLPHRLIRREVGQ